MITLSHFNLLQHSQGTEKPLQRDNRKGKKQQPGNPSAKPSACGCTDVSSLPLTANAHFTAMFTETQDEKICLSWFEQLLNATHSFS